MNFKNKYLINTPVGEVIRWALFTENGEIDIVPTVLFGKMCEESKTVWGETTQKSYAQIIEMFFRALRIHNTSIQTVSSRETQGFMQAYYSKALPYQTDNGVPLSQNRMHVVEYLLSELFDKAVKYGFRELNNVSFRYKFAIDIPNSMDEADLIYTSYISEDLFNTIIGAIKVKSNFERSRDELALRLGYEVGLRSEELVRFENFSIKRLKSARLNWKLGDEIEWKDLLGKGRKGGKFRNVLIKPCLVEKIFEHMDDFECIYRISKHLFCTRNGLKLSSKHGTNVMSDAIKNLHIAELRDKTFHKLRHSYATNLALWCIKHQVNKRLIQDRLGHTHFATSQIYIEVALLINGDFKASDEMRMVRLEKRNFMQKRASNEER